MERRHQHPAKQYLSGLQQSLLQWLYTDLHQRYRTDGNIKGVPYPDILRAVTADKASVTTALRQLMRKGLVLITLPRGGWTRWVRLTEQGKAYANTLAITERQPSAMTHADDGSRGKEGKRNQRASARRRDHEGKGKRRRSDRHTRRR
ncbi:hypothetical protein NKDENANG_02540 [Candidatus Entotheonellaceae bacterium PAL068K]